MKFQHKILSGVMTIALGSMAFTACTDSVKFGDAFVEKAPGGTVTMDTVFNSAEYTKQFLVGCYVQQYYGLPYKNPTGSPWSQSYWNSKLDALTDCYHQHFSGSAAYTKYYSNALTANDDAMISYNNDKVWETVHHCWLLIENIDRVPGLSDAEKASMIAQAKCLIAARYFDLFSVYGGLPIVEKTYTGLEGDLSIKRATAEETVNFMVKLLDEAIPNLRWAYNGSTTDTDESNVGRWTAAGAMALKAKILLFNASPLYNADQPYYDGSSKAEQEHVVWHGNFDQARWQRCLDACKAFMDRNAQEGNYYALNQASAKTPDAYRQAYRMGYVLQGSHEILHSTRVAGTTSKAASYQWPSFVGPGFSSTGPWRHSYGPTQEYVDMFCWSDGTLFDWQCDSTAGNINGDKGKLFFEVKTGRGGASQITASRDPRLYENAIVNGQKERLNWATGVSEGDRYELWVGGYHEGYQVANEQGTIVEQDTERFPSGYGTIKYYLGTEYYGKFTQWVYLSYDEMLLMYAEALAQCGQLDEAIKYVDQVRARVGLSGLKVGISKMKNSYKDASGATQTKTKPNMANKDEVIEQILRERACELGMSNNRYYDMIRYKRGDWMTKQLHGLVTYRLLKVGTNWNRHIRAYIGDDKDAGVAEPTRFEFSTFPLGNRSRVLWEYDANDLNVRKWFLFPLPISEINKNYGLVQNPGW